MPAGAFAQSLQEIDMTGIEPGEGFGFFEGERLVAIADGRMGFRNHAACWSGSCR